MKVYGRGAWLADITSQSVKSCSMLISVFAFKR